ncbi:MAG: hypothetical protein N2450_00210 [bacterium]|nr:hypothetical protein [bacterium]
MLKKLFFLVFIIATPSFATIGVGVQFVNDFWKSNEIINLPVQLNDGNTASLVREAMTNPSGIGAFLVIGISKYELQVDAEYVTRKYETVLTRPSGSGQITDKVSAVNARIGLCGTIKYKMLNIPGFTLFTGAGLGMQLQTPIVNAEYVRDVVQGVNQNFQVKSSDLLKKSNISGFHLLVQSRVKPPAAPIGLQVTVRGLILPNTKFERPSLVPSAMIGLGYFPL